MDRDAAEKLQFTPVDPCPKMVPDPAAVDRALQLLASAKRPAILLGKGAAFAQADDKIRALVEKTGIPYYPMSMAKACCPTVIRSARYRRAVPSWSRPMWYC